MVITYSLPRAEKEGPGIYTQVSVQVDSIWYSRALPRTREKLYYSGVWRLLKGSLGVDHKVEVLVGCRYYFKPYFLGAVERNLDLMQGVF